MQELLDALSRYGLSPSFARKRLEGLQVGANGSTHQLQPTEQEEFVGAGVQGGQRQVRRAPELHPRPRREAPAQPQRREPAQRADAPRRAPARSPGEEQRPRFTRPGRATSSPSRRSRGWRSATRSRTRATRRSCRCRTSRTPMFGLAIEPKTRGDEQKISTGLHKIAERRPDREGDARPADARTGHQRREPAPPGRDPRAAEGPVRRGGDHEGAEDPVPRDDQRRRRPATTGTRSRPAAAASSPRSTCASTRCRARSRRRSSARSEFANKSKFEKLRSCHYDPAYNFAFIDHIVGGTIPNNFIPAVEKGCKEMLDRGVLAGYRMQDCAVEVHFGKYHDVDSSEAAFKTAARHAFRKAFLAARPVAAGADREARDHGAVASTPGRSSATCRRSGRTSRTRTACPAT